jgi:hypothetical protein
VLSAPAAVFVVVNLLKFPGSAFAPFDTLAAIGSVLGATEVFNRAGPVVMLIAPVISLALVVAACVRPYGCVERRSVTFTGVELRWHPLAFATGLITACTLIALGAYALLENLVRAVR